MLKDPKLRPDWDGSSAGYAERHNLQNVIRTAVSAAGLDAPAQVDPQDARLQHAPITPATQLALGE